MLFSIKLLVLGSALGQGIQLFFQPFLARIYDPFQFGIFAQVLSVSSVMSVVGTLQMQNAMVLPKEEEEAVDLFLLGTLSSTVFFICAIFFLSLGAKVVFGSDNSERIAVSCAFLLISTCYVNLLRGWQTSRNLFKLLSVFSIIRASSVVGCQILLGIFYVRHGLVYGAITGEVFCVSLFLLYRKIPSPLGIFQIRFISRLRKTVINYSDFVVFGTLQECVSVMAFMLPMYMFARTYSPDIGGQYSMASRLIWAPVILLGSSTGQVVYRHLADCNQDDLHNTISLHFKKYLFPILLIGAFLSVFTPILVRLLLGEGWELASEISRWVVVWGVFFLLVIPYRICYRILRCQKIQMFVDLILFLLLICVFLFIHPVDPIQTMKIISSLFVLQNIVLASIIRIKIRNKC